jgi:hypothetical protein
MPENARYRHYALGSVGCVLYGDMPCSNNLDADRERSVIGYNDRWVVILSSDHRLSRGKRLPQFSDLLWFCRAFGLTNALVLDSGSSSQLYVQGAGEPVNPLTSVDWFVFGPARFVSNAIGLVPVQAGPTIDAGIADTGTIDAATDLGGGVDVRLLDAPIASSDRMDAGAPSDARSDTGSDVRDVGTSGPDRLDASDSSDVGVDSGTRADATDAAGATPLPPRPTLNTMIPSDVTYHRTYDFTGPDTCTRCANHPSDPYVTCAPPGFEFDVERHATASTRTAFESASHFCPYNASGGYYDCYKEYVCTWNPDPATGATCTCPRDREVSTASPTCRATPGIGIQLTVPPGNPGTYGYNVAFWPYEPSRPAFRVGSNVYVYAQFYLPAGQDVTARPGLDCTPSADPDVDVDGVHVPAIAGPGAWHEVLIPLSMPVGPFTTIIAGRQNCSAWLQCMNSGIWPPNAGDARGGSCILSRFEVAGYRDFCDLDRYDLELVVDDCVGCTLGHDLRVGGEWLPDVPGTLSGTTMTWRFRGQDVQQNCQLDRHFNVRLPSGSGWLIDDRWAPVTPTYSTEILIRKRARWRYMNGSSVVSSVDVGCNMTAPNIGVAGHHGQMRISNGRVVAHDMPDLPCSGP